MSKRPSAEFLASCIADALRADPAAEKAFRADPVKFLEKQSGQSLPPGLRVEIHENSDQVWHIPLGTRLGARASGPVDEVELGAVSGGFADFNLDSARGRRTK